MDVYNNNRIKNQHQPTLPEEKTMLRMAKGTYNQLHDIGVDDIVSNSLIPVEDHEALLALVGDVSSISFLAPAMK